MNQNDPDILSGLLLFVLMAVVGSLLLFATRNHRQGMRFQVRLFLCAFALRFVASIIIYQFGFVKVLGDEDASGWVRGLILQRGWVRQGVSLFDLPSVLTGAYAGGHIGYSYLLGALFYITDASARLPAAALNCFLGALTVIFAYRVAASLFSQSIAVRVGWWTCLFPSMIIWSAQTLKEPVVILLETVALYGCVQLKLSGFSIRHMLLCVAAICLVIPFRFYAAYIAGASVALTLILPQLSKRKITIGAAIGIAALVIPILMMSGVLVQQEAQFESFDIERVENFRRNIAVDTGSGVESNFDLHSPVEFAEAAVFGGVHLMLAPFPWQLGGASLRMLLVLPELVVWWWLFFTCVLPGLWYSARRRFSMIQPLLFFLFGMGLLYSLMFGNVGLAYRQRAQLLPWLLIFGAVGLELRALKRIVAPRLRRQEEVSIASHFNERLGRTPLPPEAQS